MKKNTHLLLKTVRMANSVKHTFLIALWLWSYFLPAQNVIISDNPAATADPAAMLEVKSTDKGLLIPRMSSSQRNAILNAPVGLLVFDTDTESFWFREGSGWTAMGNLQVSPPLQGNGTAANPLTIGQNGATNGQVLAWNGMSWQPSASGNREIAIFEEVTPSSGGASGGTATAGSGNRRKLNVGEDTPNIKLNPINNTFTVQPGTYIVQASAPAFAIGKHQIILRDQTFDTNVLLGTNEYITSNGGVQTSSFIHGIITPAIPTTYRLDHWVEFGSSDPASLGLSHTGLSSGTSNYYARVVIEKIK